jgi:acyl-CoA reductase-like NAD-dependent aldehyde dehydrogenase
MSLSTQTRPKPGSELRHVRMLIDGDWVDSASGAVLTVENPARRSRVASIPRGDKEDVDRAVQAAHKAIPDWRKIPPRQRGRLLLKIAEAMEARIDELARIIAEETGNALRTQARPEATLTADIFRYFGGLAGS